MWRYRYDKFGWTTHSSQVHESKLLRIASPMFHFGMLFVVIGHLVGLLIPQSWTDKVGVDDHTYHLFAVSTGAVAGIPPCRHRHPGVPAADRARRAPGDAANDQLMYPVLFAAMLLGLTATLPLRRATATTTARASRSGPAACSRSSRTMT